MYSQREQAGVPGRGADRPWSHRRPGAERHEIPLGTQQARIAGFVWQITRAGEPESREESEQPVSPLGEVIYAYTRAQAIEDGVLVDVTEQARQSGWRYPVAVTRAVWDDCCVWTERDAQRSRAHQDTTGRLHDVLYLAHIAVRTTCWGGEDTAHFQLRRRPRPGHGLAQLVALKAVCHPGDEGEPVVTIMQPQED
jgi:hypothetical protein